MNTNQKKLKLIGHGLKASTLNKLTEGQVDALIGKLQEQITTTTKQVKTVTVPQNIAKTTGADIGNVNVKTDANGNVIATEMQENEIGEKFESKKQQKYFFAKCGDGKTKEQKKWCKMADEFAKKTNFAKLPEKKKETKEEFNFGDYNKKVISTITKLNSDNLNKVNPGVTGMGNPTSDIFTESEIEKQIMRLVEKHITPKMSKKDFIRTISESPEVLPKPGTKPAPTITPNPDFDPFDEPDPSDDPEARNPEVSPKPGTKPAPTITPNPDFDPFNDPDPSDDPEAKSDGFRFFMGQVKKNRMIK